jgi:hypothetical protein
MISTGAEGVRDHHRILTVERSSYIVRNIGNVLVREALGEVLSAARC